MINQNGAIGEMLETGQTTLKHAAKQGVRDVASSTKGQITGSGSSSSPSDQGTNEPATAQQQKMSDDDAKKFLQDLYGKSDNNSGSNNQNKPKNSGPVTQALGVSQDPNAGKTPEELAKIQALRNQLHGDYYQNLVNRPKPKEEPVVEKLEREEQMAALEENKKQKEKPGPLQNVKQGTGESVVGISG